jgi:tetratricopeptide (TPR) repeat protein
MAIEVHCDCGNVYSVGPELSGKKLRCKTCKVVLKVPVVPLGESAEAAPPSDEYEVVKDDGSVTCPTCGAAGKADDAVCLACGAELGEGAPGLLGRVPKPVLFAVIGVVLVLVVGGVGWKLYHASYMNGLVAAGREKYEKGDLKGAQKAFEEVLKDQRDSDGALAGIVQVGIAAGDWRLVNTWGPPLIAHLPKGERRARAHLDVARAQLETGNNSGAIKSANEAVAEGTGIEGSEEIVGLAHLAASDKTDALEMLKKADAAGSHDPRVGLGLAKLIEPTSVHDARVWADKGAGNAGDGSAASTVWLECARLREKDGDATGAIAAVRRACETDPKSALAHVKLAVALLDTKDWAAALVAAKAAQEIAPDDPVGLRALGEALLETGDVPGAKVELEHAEKVAADDPLPSFLLGKALIRGKDAAGGIDKLEKALKKFQNDPLPWLEAGKIVLAETDQPDRAVTMLDRALTLEPKPIPPADRKTYAEGRILLARAFAKVDRAKNSRLIEDRLRQAIELDPKRRDAYYELGNHLQEDGIDRAREGLEVLEKGLEIYDDDEDLLYKAGVAGIKAKGASYKKAVEHLEKLVKKNPNYPDARQKLDAAKLGQEFDPGN